MTMNRGLVFAGRGQYEDAVRLYREGMAMFQELGDTFHIAACLTRMASVAAVTGEPESGAAMAGAAEAIREKLGAALPAYERAYYEPAVGAMEALLGEEKFREAWEKGREMSVEQAVDYGLGQ